MCPCNPHLTHAIRSAEHRDREPSVARLLPRRHGHMNLCHARRKCACVESHAWCRQGGGHEIVLEPVMLCRQVRHQGAHRDKVRHDGEAGWPEAAGGLVGSGRPHVGDRHRRLAPTRREDLPQRGAARQRGHAERCRVRLNRKVLPSALLHTAARRSCMDAGSTLHTTPRIARAASGQGATPGPTRNP